jgi:hypothetical protein
MEILDLKKWHSQTIASVGRVLDEAQAPCVGFNLVFMDMIDKDWANWKFKTMLAFDPNNPPPQEDREKLEYVFSKFAEFVQAIMSGNERGHDA